MQIIINKCIKELRIYKKLKGCKTRKDVLRDKKYQSNYTCSYV